MKIIKRINNNAVLCLDGDGNRVVALGSGLGCVKLQEELDLDLVDHTFYDIEPRYVDLLRDLPADHIELAARIADMARAMLSYELSPHLDIALADHISFAIKRSKEGIYLQMPFTYDIQQSYPVEYKIAEYAVRLVKSDLGVLLPPTEVSGVAMGIVNSAVAPSGRASADQARRQEDALERITGIVEDKMGVRVDREGFGYSRFATHVQYLMRRVLDGDPIASENSGMYAQLVLDNPKVSACVDVISSAIEEEFEAALTEEEKLYLILHVNRICARSDG